MRRPLLLTALLALACGGDDGASMSTSASTSAAPTTSTSGATTSAATGSTATDTAATTGVPLCHFGSTGDSGGADGPWLELYHQGLPLVEGGALQLQCGGQGVFMFEIYPVFGGFTPTDDYVDFQVVLDIDGKNDNPTGHFYGESTHGILVGCIDDYYGNSPTTLQLLPNDEISALADLDGLPAHLHLSFTADGQTLSADLDLTIDAAPNEGWMFCDYGDSGWTTGGTTDTGTSTDGTTDTGTSTGTGP